MKHRKLEITRKGVYHTLDTYHICRYTKPYKLEILQMVDDYIDMLNGLIGGRQRTAEAMRYKVLIESIIRDNETS